MQANAEFDIRAKATQIIATHKIGNQRARTRFIVDRAKQEMREVIHGSDKTEQFRKAWKIANRWGCDWRSRGTRSAQKAFWGWGWTEQINRRSTQGEVCRMRRLQGAHTMLAAPQKTVHAQCQQSAHRVDAGVAWLRRIHDGPLCSLSANRRSITKDMLNGKLFTVLA